VFKLLNNHGKLFQSLNSVTTRCVVETQGIVLILLDLLIGNSLLTLLRLVILYVE